jgi:hypothetical protein
MMRTVLLAAAISASVLGVSAQQHNIDTAVPSVLFHIAEST